MTASNNEDFRNYKISLYEPFAKFLHGNLDEYKFEISLMDVIHLAGHACPAMVGAFLMASRAIEELYPESGTGIRGEIAVDIAASPTQGATGPISNVFSYITGAWADTGFGGLNGRFQRRGLLCFESPSAPRGGYRFTRISTGDAVDLFYDPQKVPLDFDPSEPFQIQWRKRVKAVLGSPELAVTCVRRKNSSTI